MEEKPQEPTIAELLSRIAQTPGCKVLPAVGLPQIEAKDALPADLREFYERCGGVTLFDDGERSSLRIRPPDEMILSNKVVRFMEREEWADDPSWYWYAIADYAGDNQIVIDMHPERVGLCYDGFYETYAVVGQTPVIALSFTELLRRWLDYSGEMFFWCEDGFVPYAYAYEWLEGEAS